MNCKDCPYISEQLHRGVGEYYAYSVAYLSPEEIAEWLSETCWCDKTGGKLSWYGYCTDAFDLPVSSKSHSKKSRRTKRERDLKYKNHLKFLAEIPGYHPLIWKVDEMRGYCNGKWWSLPLEKSYYKRSYMDNHKGGRYSYYKKYANRRVRRYKGEIHNGGSYRKVSEFWWNVD